MLARGAWVVAPRTIELREETLPPPGAGEVCIEAIASAISHGTEMLVYRGQVPEGLELDLPTLRGSFAFPIKYGYASVGRVIGLGPEVVDLARGDAVFVHHPHQSRYVVPASMPQRLPDGLDPLLGVFFANVETAVTVVLDAAPRLGERAIVFGQGVVGLLITQLLKQTGVSELTVVDPFPRRRALALEFGADAAHAPTEDLAGCEFDVAIEASGSPAALDQALASLVFGGTVVVCSWYGTKPVALYLGGAFHRRRLRMFSSQVGTIDAALQPRWSRERRSELALQLLTRLALRPLVSHTFALDAAAQAYDLVDRQPDDTVQVVLTYPHGV